MLRSRNPLVNAVVRRSDPFPISRAFGAALAAFALAAQLVLSGIVVGCFVGAADQSDDAWIVCTHDAGAADQTGPGKPQPAKSHNECPAWTCAQTFKLTPPLPAPPLLAVLQGRSELMPMRPVAAAPARHSPSPYASRAPPSFA
jgi:hypothetical protein